MGFPFIYFSYNVCQIYLHDSITSMIPAVWSRKSLKMEMPELGRRLVNKWLTHAHVSTHTHTLYTQSCCHHYILMYTLHTHSSRSNTVITVNTQTKKRHFYNSSTVLMPHFPLISFSCTHKINHDYIHTQTWQISLTLVLCSIINCYCIRKGWKIYSRPTLQDFIFLHNHHWNLWQEINTNQFSSKKFLNAEATHMHTYTHTGTHAWTPPHTHTTVQSLNLAWARSNFLRCMIFIWTFLTVVTLKLVNVTGTTCSRKVKVQHRLPLCQAWEIWLNPLPSLKTAQDLLGVFHVCAGCHTKPCSISWLFTAFPCESQPSRGTYQLDLTLLFAIFGRGEFQKGRWKG